MTTPQRSASPSWLPRFLARLLVLVGVLCGPSAWAQPPSSEKPGVVDQQTAGRDSSKPRTAVGEQEGWKQLFDGKTLKDWKITPFGGEGEVTVEDGTIVMEMGSSLTGITYVPEFPQCDYEVRVEAKRVSGIDFFSTVTFPVKDSFCSLVVGGWAGPLVGISCVDHADASENSTTTYQKFETGKWYQIRIQVRQDRIRAWIDDKQVVDLDIQGHTLTTRVEVCLNEPFGIASWETAAAIRKIEMRRLAPPPDRTADHEAKLDK